MGATVLGAPAFRDRRDAAAGAGVVTPGAALARRGSAM